MSKRDATFPFRASRPTARVRLLCLPFAGGTAATYRTWAAAFPAWIDVCALELPGHGSRLDVAQETTMEGLVRAVCAAVQPLAPPLAVFGHSMGARLGFELCRALDPRPIHLFASGAPGPECPSRRNFSHLSRAALLVELQSMNQASAEVLANVELMDLLLPIIRTDLVVSEAHRCVAAPPLDLPITVLTGREDGDVTVDEARAWARGTTRPFADPVVFEGSHFFLEPHASRVQQLIVETLDAELR